MSAPEPNFDQLLSDHLDGRLDEPQAEMLAQSLREDPALQAKFEALQSDRLALRQMFAASASAAPALPSDFAARVLAEGRRRGLHAHSPARPGGLEAPKSRLRLQLLAGVLVTAASVLIVVSLVRIGRAPDDGVQTLAHNQPAIGSRSGPSVDAVGPGSVLPERGGMEPLVAVAEPDSESPATTDSMSANTDLRLQQISPKPSLDAVASAAPAARGDAAMADDQSPAVSVTDDKEAMLFGTAFTGAMMVYDVRLTPQGRERGAVARAIQRNGLGESHRQAINRDVIAAAKQANAFDEDARYQVIYLQAPAKKVDRVFLDLLKDRREVQSVGLTLVTDLPLLQVAGRAVHADAVQIKHDRPLSLELGGDGSDAELDALRGLLNNQVFIPLVDSETSEHAAGMDSLSSPSNDVMTRVLILVR